MNPEPLHPFATGADLTSDAPDVDDLPAASAALPTSLALGDVEAIVRLINAALAPMALDPAASATPAAPLLAKRRRVLLEGLAQLVDADTWIWIRYRIDRFDAPRPVPFELIDGGYRDEAERGRFVAGASDEALGARLDPIMIGPTHRTNVLHQMLPPGPENAGLRDRWHAKSGMDDFLVSSYPVGGRTWSGLALYRRLGRPHFTPRELAIVHVVVGQLDWLHRTGVEEVRGNSDVLLSLSPRERQVLILLLGGDSAKGIALKMTLSQHTVNDHIKAIYRRLNVATRPELMNLFMAGSSHT